MTERILSSPAKGNIPLVWCGCGLRHIWPPLASHQLEPRFLADSKLLLS
jgi:hypothetical protein